MAVVMVVIMAVWKERGLGEFISAFLYQHPPTGDRHIELRLSTSLNNCPLHLHASSLPFMVTPLRSSGLESGRLVFLDMSLYNQQPTFKEAQNLILLDKVNKYAIVKVWSCCTCS